MHSSDHDLGLISPIDRSKVINRSKIPAENAGQLLRNSARMNQFDHPGIKGLFVDGRNDRTLAQVLGVDNKCHREEHMVAEPGSLYFSHTTPAKTQPSR